ncbi:MAG: 23S rRNA (adenine(2503)-C(2))-methyltransferase RlmN [Spirochaetales bacterium]|nr:23S rRNA (adenine(2503)-C(2))-methyltransferase RlmN [Spirochaetales bacterium]
MNPANTDILPIASLLPQEISDALNIKPLYRCRQIFSWIQKGVFKFDDMTNLPAELRQNIKSRAVAITSQINQTNDDGNGNIKIRLQLQDGNFIESVLLVDDEGRKTACLSSQVGCAMGCSFCATGRIGLIRNCRDYEIVEQFLLFKSLYGSISNVVFMGMGEPLLNIESVRKAVNILHDKDGQNMGYRKMTLSTCGLPEEIREFALNGPPIRLAVSLVTADQVLRTKLMPVAKKNSLDELKEALLYYQNKTKNMITLEIVLIKDVNDMDKHIKQLVKFIRPMKVNVNIIPYNPVSSTPYQTPDNAVINHFRSMLEKEGINVTRRYRKGTSINAACGQLGGKTDAVQAK